MKITKTLFYLLLSATLFTSCVAKKKMTLLQLQYNDLKNDLEKRGVMVNEMTQKYNDCEQQKALLGKTIEGKDDMIKSLNSQLAESKTLQSKQNKVEKKIQNKAKM